MHDVLQHVSDLLTGAQKAGKNCRLVSSTGLVRDEDPSGKLTLSFQVELDFLKEPVEGQADLMLEPFGEDDADSE